MKPNDETTEKRIRESARRIFQKKGLAGARMQEIADDVGINKSMLHYYFDTKENLFSAVFEESVATLFGVLTRVLVSDIGFRAKVELFVSEYVDVLLANPHIPTFVLGELNRDPSRMGQFVKKFDSAQFLEDVRAEVASGRIRPVDPRTILADLLSLTAFPFAARPLIQGMFAFDDDDFRAFAESRKRHVPAALFATLAP